ncbi:MAG TPA: gliding motility-associated C-terminal domain-containing protein [Bacteroidia bacterium]|nr:gliding motility-associated C-terminal domain-containing protein [Bacteroidia bacterium]
MKINYSLLVVAISACILQPAKQTEAQGTTGAGGTSIGGQKVWTTNPFDYQVFIENKGQYDGKIQTGDKILFAARTGPGFAYFTTKGVVYRYDEFVGKDGKSYMSRKKKEEEHKEGEDDNDDEFIKDIPHFLSATWKGSNSAVTISTDEKLPGYYNFPLGEESNARKSVKTSGYKKITYNNIYPGIDAVYSFTKGKAGFEYTLIVHPGANLAAVKLAYDGEKKMKVDGNGSLVVGCSWGKLTDHTPVSHYEENGDNVQTSYTITNNEESFSVNNRNSSNTLIIDPWVTLWTTTVLASNSSNDGAYDLDYDYYGNVYVYGGNYPYQVVKLSSAGVVLWTYVTSNFTYPYYGDFAVEKTSGSVFACEGFGANTGAITDKINNAGALALSFTATSSSDEDWRMDYDLCDHEIIIAGGGTYSDHQATILDTNLSTSTYVNVLGFPNASFPYEYHDMYGISLDPEGGFCYMSPAHTASSSIDNNVIVKMPMPTLTPTLYNVPNGYAFQEVFSIPYVNTGVGNANGMNCMTSNSNYVFMYDGITLKEFNSGTGAQLLTATLTGTSSFEWGGIDVDLCNNVYLGNQSDVQVYNAALANTGTITGFPGTIFDVVLGNGILGYGDSTLYVCGDGFISRVALTSTTPPKIVKTVTKVCSCNCTAEATLFLCGAPDTVGVTYKWSSGQTTRTATGLCPGSIDSITITVGCGEIFRDTVMIPLQGLLAVTKAQTGATCVNPGTASLTVTTGTPPYTYLWSNGATTSSIGGLGAGNYCVSVTDNKGCNDTVCFIISGTPLPTITVTPPLDTICIGSTTPTLTAGGAVSYVWAPSNGLSCATCPNPTASPTATTTYTITGTDANGCVNKDSITITVEPLPLITVTPQNDTVCQGNQITLTAGGGVTYAWTPVTSQLSSQTGSSVTVTPTVTTTYTVTGTDAHGCINETTVTVNYAAPPTINVRATRISLCEGSPTTLIASATNSTGIFTWQPGNLTGPTVSVTPTVTTTYTVSTTNFCGTASATVTINVNQLPNTLFRVDNASGCSPLCVQFRDKSTSASGNIIQWRWNFGNGDSSNVQNPIYCYPNSGNYSVDLTTVTDSGCSSTLSQFNYITVYSHPNGSFSMSPQPTNILNATIQFTDNSTDAYGLAYWIWNFGVTGNDTLSDLQNPSYTYWDTGTFCPSEVVMNIHGCVDTVTNCLVIGPAFTCYIPDAFTPNGDGKNEKFMVHGNDIKTFEMYIFDRWGQQLFHTTDINDGWDGSAKAGGAVQQEDSYVYLITIYDTKNQKHSYLGRVNLIK